MFASVSTSSSWWRQMWNPGCLRWFRPSRSGYAFCLKKSRSLHRKFPWWNKGQRPRPFKKSHAAQSPALSEKEKDPPSTFLSQESSCSGWIGKACHRRQVFCLGESRLLLTVDYVSSLRREGGEKERKDSKVGFSLCSLHSNSKEEDRQEQF